jgi:intracellular multiplication protein IcmD
MKRFQSRNAQYWAKVLLRLFVALLPFFAISALAVAPPAGGAAGSLDLSGVSKNIIGNFGELARLITAAAYVAGFGFAFAAILKFKAHKDNPQQIPVGTPIALLFVAAALIFLPTLFGVSGATVFGSGASAGTVSGIASF